jgi:WD40 repeat protein
MESALKNGEANIVEKSKKHLKTSFIFLDSSVRCISWHGHDDPDKLIVGGYDGKLILVDINDSFLYLLLHRSRGKV